MNYERTQENSNYHGLVDMDRDFEKRELIGHHRTYDTNPLVTFPSYAFRHRDTAIRVVKNIGGSDDFLNKAEKIVRLAKILTIIKLFKGRTISKKLHWNSSGGMCQLILPTIENCCIRFPTSKLG